MGASRHRAESQSQAGFPAIAAALIVVIVATERQRARCRERLESLSESSLDCESIQREAIADLRSVIGFDRWCWPFADPETLLPLSGLAEHDYGPALARALELEFSGDDFGAKHVLARRANSAGSLDAETGGDLACSARWDEVMRPVGIGDVATVACRDALGCWGWVELYRDAGDPAFSREDVELLAEAGPSLGAALRRSLVETNGGGPAEANDGPLEFGPPGVVVLDRELRVVSSTAAARAWIDAMPAAWLFASWGMLPAVVYPAATLARAGVTAEAHALIRAVDGRWIMIDAAPLEGREEAQVAVSIRAASPSETFELLCRVYALSPRERELAALVVAGLDTHALARQLDISRHTVQDHLKSVFDKVGIHSRRELLATLSASGLVPSDRARLDAGTS